MRIFRRTSVLSVLFLVVSMQTVFADNSPKYKNPDVAEELATYIPGAGHIYSGEWIRGSLMLLGSATTSVGGYVYSMQTADSGDTKTLVPTLAGIAVGFGIYAYSLFDAGNSARRMNARHGLQSLRIVPEVSKDSGGMRYGVAVSLPSSVLGL